MSESSSNVILPCLNQKPLRQLYYIPYHLTNTISYKLMVIQTVFMEGFGETKSDKPFKRQFCRPNLGPFSEFKSIQAKHM